MPKMPKRVTVEEASNGFMVSMYDEKHGEMKMVCKDMGEVHKTVEKMMSKSGKANTVKYRRYA